MMVIKRSVIILLIIALVSCDSNKEKELKNREIIVVKPENLRNRVALVVGNSKYQNITELSNPVNDANDMSEKLKKLGFDVIEKYDVNKENFKKAINEFGDALDKGSIGLFFYAGHSIQANGINYLVPVCASPKNENDVEFDCVHSGRVLSKMDHARTHLNIMILDACRNNPFKSSWRDGNEKDGLANMDAPSGTLIAFATSPGGVASDGRKRNGLFTSSLLKYIDKPSLTIENVLKLAGMEVSEHSNKSQTPCWNSSYYGNFYFTKSEEVPYYTEDEIIINEDTIPEIPGVPDKPENDHLQLDEFEYGFAVVKENQSNMRGYINLNKELVIPYQFDSAWNFFKNIAKVYRNGYFLINKKGQNITNIKYDEIDNDWHYELARVRQGKKWGFVYFNGTSTPVEYDIVVNYSEGFGLVKKNGLWQFINTSGQVCFGKKFQQAIQFSRGKAKVKYRNKNRLINKYGKFIK